MQITLIGAGAGPDTLTAQALAALTRAQAVVGAPRLLKSLGALYECPAYPASTARDMLAALEALDCEHAAVVFSGDSGFFSGARSLLPLLDQRGWEARVLPGISSVQMLAARLGRPWQDWRLVSAHGVDADAPAELMGGKPVFFLTGGKLGPAELCGQLVRAGLDKLSVTVGENLACPDERIISGTAAELAGKSFAPLSVLLAEAAPVLPRRAPGWPDDVFIRGNTPMTKQTVRAAVLSKLAVTPHDVCWDVGAGAGSVSVELAAMARRVYAVERDTDACGLIEQNREKFHAWNLSVIQGSAPEALESLPAPDAVFIGGSGGHLGAILDAAFARNRAVRVCVSAVTLETVHAAVEGFARLGLEPDIVQIAVSGVKRAGQLHMLAANDPVFLITGGRS